jgi:tetratricopeptide (TPR) repeat protein
MPPENESIPSCQEVERQLERILAGKRFANSPNQAMLLDYVVRKALKGTSVTEDEAGVALFPGYVPDGSTDVRVTASNMRKRLSEYYAKEGGDDRVLITLPKGNYTALFGYNPSASDDRYYRRVMNAYSEAWNISDLANVVVQFEKAIAHDPTYAPTHAAKAEAQFVKALCGGVLGNARTFIESDLAAAKLSAEIALGLNPTSWRAHIVLGAIHSCSYEWEQAEAAFTSALEIASTQTRGHFLYWAFLLAVGEVNKALEFSEFSANDSSADTQKQTSFALVLYLMRDFAKANAVLSNVGLTGGYLGWLGLTVLGCLCIELHKSRVPFLNPPPITYFLWEGLLIYFHCNGLFITDSEFDEDETIGLKELEEKCRYGDGRFFELAIAFTAVGKTKEAIAALKRAQADHDPLMTWLHLWPLFDPLREDDEFQSLVANMKLPSMKRDR